MLITYGAFVAARWAAVAKLSRGRSPAGDEAGKPTVPLSILNALFVVEVFLLIAASYSAASLVAAEAPDRGRL